MSGRGINRQGRGDLHISGLLLHEEGVVHPLAMRSYWEIIRRACSEPLTRPVKGVLMVVALYLLLTLPLTHQAPLTLHPHLLVYCTAAEYVTCVWLPLMEPAHSMAWLLATSLLTLWLRWLAWDSALLSALTQSSSILLLHLLVTFSLYHIYKLFIEYSVYWGTPDYRHLCCHWLTTPANNNHMLVARCGEEVCGTLGISHISSDVAMFNRMVVDPQHRGMGIGKELVVEALEYCRGRGYKQVLLSSTNYSPDAQYLYQQKGFRVLYQTSLYNVTFTWYYLVLVGEGVDEERVRAMLRDTTLKCAHKGVPWLNRPN